MAEAVGSGDGAAVGAGQPVPMVFGDVRTNFGHLVDLMDEWGRIVAPQVMATAATALGFQSNDCVRGQEGPFVFGVSAVSATLLDAG